MHAHAHSHAYVHFHAYILFGVELKNGRLPEGISRRMGFWKAEEIQKFAYPASEMIFSGILSDKEFEVWFAAVRIVECLYGCGRNGIDQEMLCTLKRLVWRHYILTEELHGSKSYVISVHNLIHLTDDIMRFSCPDNYWCYSFERAVHTYVERSSNSKHLELTFAKAESRRELLKILLTDDAPFNCVHHSGNPHGCLEKVVIYINIL